MNSYPLLIRDAQGKDTGERGTGWFIRPNLVATAFHVVGSKSLRAWVQSAPGREEDSFWLSGIPAVGPSEKGVQLTHKSPSCFDFLADVALLACWPVRNVEVSALTDVAEEGESWWADGFPGPSGEVRRLTGRITADRGDRLELFVQQGTEVTWAGISGTPIYTPKGIAGIVTDEVPRANTLEAASFKVLGKLLAAMDAIKREAGSLRRLGIDWTGDIHKLRQDLASRIEMPKLFEALREPLIKRQAIRVVAGIDEELPNVDARRVGLHNLHGVEIDLHARSLYVGDAQSWGIYRIRNNCAPELLAEEVRWPAQLALDDWMPEKSLYVASVGAHIVQKVSIATGETETIAGSGLEGFSGDGGPALKASFRRPCGVAVIGSGDTLFIADTGNHRIRRVYPRRSSVEVETIAGNGTAGYSGDHGPALAAQLNRPAHVEWDRSPSVCFFRTREITA
jgi:hypothetical protein